MSTELDRLAFSLILLIHSDIYDDKDSPLCKAAAAGKDDTLKYLLSLDKSYTSKREVNNPCQLLHHDDARINSEEDNNDNY